MVGEEVVSSDSEGEGGEDDEGKKRMEPDEEGVLRLEGGSNEDDLDSLNGLFHWQMEDYELFSSCNMLRVDKGEKEGRNECPKKYREAKEGKAVTAEVEGKNIPYGQYKRKNIPYKPNKRKDSTVRYMVNGLRGKKRLHPTMDLVERYWQKRKHIIWFAQETKRKGLIKTAGV